MEFLSVSNTWSEKLKLQENTPLLSSLSAVYHYTDECNQLVTTCKVSKVSFKVINESKNNQHLEVVGGCQEMWKQSGSNVKAELKPEK